MRTRGVHASDVTCSFYFFRIKNFYVTIIHFVVFLSCSGHRKPICFSLYLLTLFGCACCVALLDLILAPDSRRRSVQDRSKRVTQIDYIEPFQRRHRLLLLGIFRGFCIMYGWIPIVWEHRIVWSGVIVAAVPATGLGECLHVTLRRSYLHVPLGLFYKITPGMAFSLRALRFPFVA